MALEVKSAEVENRTTKNFSLEDSNYHCFFCLEIKPFTKEKQNFMKCFNRVSSSRYHWNEEMHHSKIRHFILDLLRRLPPIFNFYNSYEALFLKTKEELIKRKYERNDKGKRIKKWEYNALDMIDLVIKNMNFLKIAMIINREIIPEKKEDSINIYDSGAFNDNYCYHQSYKILMNEDLVVSRVNNVYILHIFASNKKTALIVLECAVTKDIIN